MVFNAIEKAKEIEKVIIRGNKRKYYRLGRSGRWYGGISTADCCGCNLKCVFCWSSKQRDAPEKTGNFYSPEEVSEELLSCAKKKNYNLLRLSGNEPTIGKNHLLNLLEILSKEKYIFILETNGTLLDMDFLKDLKNFKKLHIRVSLKGTTREEFSTLTDSLPETFDLIINNLKSLVDLKLKFNLAVMLSFSPKNNIIKLLDELKKISEKILENFEEEYVILYPLVKEKLRKANITPFISFSPEGFPEKLI